MENIILKVCYNLRTSLNLGESSRQHKAITKKFEILFLLQNELGNNSKLFIFRLHYILTYFLSKTEALH